MTKYAEGTTVSVEKSQAEIKRLLKAAGAVRPWPIEDEPNNQGFIMFELHGRRVLMFVPYPNPDAREFHYFGTSWRKRPNPKAAWQAEVQRRWRVALIRIKVRLELAEGDAQQFEREFLADILLPAGTVGDLTAPAIAMSYATGQMPTLLLDRPVPQLPPPQLPDANSVEGEWREVI